jgi:hypothetical protein
MRASIWSQIYGWETKKIIACGPIIELLHTISSKRSTKCLYVRDLLKFMSHVCSKLQ